MLERPIPSSGERVPVIGLGTWRAFDVGASRAEREPLKEVLGRFVALGGRVVDSSPMYGAAESVVGDLAAELAIGDTLFLATKVWTGGREAGIAQMEQSLRRLRVRRLDLMQIHNLLDWRTHLATLRAWKEAGRIRYLGVTHYTASAYDELERVLRGEPLDFVQVNYSLGEREAERRILPVTRERGVAVLVNRPFADGGLFQRVRGRALPAWAAEFDCESWAQFFLKWILAHPAVTCVIPGTSRPDHAADNMAAGRGRLPDAATRERMTAVIARLEEGLDTTQQLFRLGSRRANAMARRNLSSATSETALPLRLADVDIVAEADDGEDATRIDGAAVAALLDVAADAERLLDPEDISLELDHVADVLGALAEGARPPTAGALYLAEHCLRRLAARVDALRPGARVRARRFVITTAVREAPRDYAAGVAVFTLPDDARGDVARRLIESRLKRQLLRIT